MRGIFKFFMNNNIVAKTGFVRKLKKSPRYAVCCKVLNLPKQVGPATGARLGRSLSRYPDE